MSNIGIYAYMIATGMMVVMWILSVIEDIKKGRDANEDENEKETYCIDWIPSPKIPRNKWEFYRKYIRSSKWKNYAKRIRYQAGYKCSVCEDSDVQLDVHHITYKRLGNEDIGDCVCLCNYCHMVGVHGRDPNTLNKRR